MDWLNKNTIFTGILGSVAYGLNTPESDIDIRGVCISPKEYYFGLLNFEQKESKDPDSCIFDIKKYFKLALEANPNILEYMFLDQEYITKTTKHWNDILNNRDLFLSKRAKHRYSGYSYSQLKRVKSHRHWLLSPIVEKPLRSEFGLPDTACLNKELIGSIECVIKDCLKENLEVILSDCSDNITKVGLRNYFEFDLREVLDGAFSDFTYPTVYNKLTNKIDIMVAIGDNYFSSDIMAIYAKEKAYMSSLNNYKQYQNWLANRNPKRAELEAKFGYDAKHL